MEKPLPTAIIEIAMKSLQLFTSHTMLQNHTGLIHMFYVIKNNLQSKIKWNKIQHMQICTNRQKGK